MLSFVRLLVSFSKIYNVPDACVGFIFFNPPVIIIVRRLVVQTHRVRYKTLAKSLEMNGKNGPNISSSFQQMEIPCRRIVSVQISLLEHRPITISVE